MIDQAVIVANGGGIKSAVALFWAKLCFSSVWSVSIAYSDTHPQELACAAELANIVGVDHDVVTIPIPAGASKLPMTLCALDSFAASLGICNVASGMNQLQTRLPHQQLREAFGFSDSVVTFHYPISFCLADTISVAQTIPGCFDALAYTNSSVDGLYPPTETDLSNQERAAAFLELGLADPLILRAAQEGLMALPATNNYDAFR